MFHSNSVEQRLVMFDYREGRGKAGQQAIFKNYMPFLTPFSMFVSISEFYIFNRQRKTMNQLISTGTMSDAYKKTVLLVLFLFLVQYTKAQECNLFNTPSAIVAYVFSEETDFTMNHLFGENIMPGLINIVWINTPELKKNINDMVFSGNAEGVFIFPDHVGSKTIRYCSAKEYLSALKKMNYDNQ